ncbi:MAG: hypothetical protein ABF876_10640 [Acetobacter aceti]|uniref:Uncharacterized protein n=1 Tax=Acetobacter aceti TaxID=435 RepID=A0A1U9KJF2_ACEAC|nr:hypothetical protein [Acetobacter aceti]AQS85886.1 hypothetical protein A0U92_15185 [Acetobacter aceti]
MRPPEPHIDDIKKRIVAEHRANGVSRQLAGIPGIGNGCERQITLDQYRPVRATLAQTLTSSSAIISKLSDLRLNYSEENSLPAA